MNQLFVAVIYVVFGLIPLVAIAERHPRVYKANMRFGDENIDLVVELSVYSMYESDPDESKYLFVADPMHQILKDLEFIDELKLPVNQALVEKWKIPTNQGNGWLNFFGARVFAITGADHENESFWTQRLAPAEGFPNADVSVLNPLTNQLNFAARLGAGEERSYVKNLNMNILQRVQQQGMPLQYKYGGFEKPISGVRAGLLRVYPGFFTETMIPAPGGPSGLPVPSKLSSVIRMAKLLHEARHSDGGAEPNTLGFAHVKCPRMHPYEGRYACDRSENGAYGIEVDFLKQFLETCANCTSDELALLQGFILQASQRIYDPKIYTKDESGSAVVKFVASNPLYIPGMPKKIATVINVVKPAPLPEKPSFEPTKTVEEIFRENGLDPPNR